MLATAVPAGAQVYRWTDERGSITYGNHPPAGAARLMRLDAEGPRHGLPGASAIRHKVPRDLPGVALRATSEFPGTVDRSTVATVRDALALRDCGRPRAKCGHAAEAGAARGEQSFPGLSALQLP